MLQSPCIEDHMNNIVIDQSLCNRSYFEHKLLNNIRKIYQHADNCDDQQNLKDILDANMVYTPEGFTDDSHILLMTQTKVLKTSVKK